MRSLWSFVLLVAVGAAAYMGWLMYRSGASTPPMMSSSRGSSTARAPAPSTPGAPGGGTVSPVRPGAVSPPPGRTGRPGACAVCGGTQWVACAVCGGDGQVERVERISCQQCGGTGQYKARMTKGENRCPFCNGKGYIEKTNRVACTSCGGTGKTVCPACAPRPR